MKTHEVVQLLDINKESLRYYEKMNLIKVHKDLNGYRDYNSEDIRLLKTIIFFRSLDMTIDEIKQVLNNELGLNNCLKNKQEVIQKEINRKLNIL